MMRARAVSIFVFMLVALNLLAGKDEPAIVLLWPNPNQATLKLTFGTFRSIGFYEGKYSLVTDVVVQNLTDQAIPRASFNVSLHDKEHVRIGNGLLVINDVNPGESVKVQFQCESVGPPVTLSVSAKNTGGVPGSARGIPLKVISVPGGASLKVDGKDEGFAPTTVNLTPGAHNLELQKDGYALTSTPIDVDANERPNGSIKITLGGLATDVVELRDGSLLTGDVMSLDLQSIVIKVDGKDRKIERNQIWKVFLVERQISQGVSAVSSPAKAPPATNPPSAHP